MEFRFTPRIGDALAAVRDRLPGPDRTLVDELAAALARRDEQIEDRLSRVPVTLAGWKAASGSSVQIPFARGGLPVPFATPPAVALTAISLTEDLSASAFQVLADKVDVEVRTLAGASPASSYTVMWTATERTDV